MAGMKSKLVPIPPKGKSAPKKSAPRSSGAIAGPVSSVSIRTGNGSKAIERSVSVREIENGFLITESRYGPKGYSDRTVYSRTPPKIDVAAIAKSRK